MKFLAPTRRAAQGPASAVPVAVADDPAELGTVERPGVAPVGTRPTTKATLRDEEDLLRRLRWMKRGASKGAKLAIGDLRAQRFESVEERLVGRAKGSEEENLLGIGYAYLAHRHQQPMEWQLAVDAFERSVKQAGGVVARLEEQVRTQSAKVRRLEAKVADAKSDEAKGEAQRNLAAAKERLKSHARALRCRRFAEHNRDAIGTFFAIKPKTS